MDIIKSKGLNFDIYIGKYSFEGQGENVIAVVKAAKGEFIPHSNTNFDGTYKGCWMECFPSINQLINYICDWFDILKDPNTVVASIFVRNILLNEKIKGEKIIDAIKQVDEQFLK